MRAQFGKVDPQCSSCEPGAVNCSKYLWTKYITRTEWNELFPNTHFYLIASRVMESPENNVYGYHQSYFIIAQQDGHRYKIERFDQLLDANNIVISDANRELVARSFALMALANYLEREVVLSNWKQVNWPSGRSGMQYNYGLAAWTKIQGRQIEVAFAFYEGRLGIAGWFFSENNTGDYVDEPPPRSVALVR